MITIYHNNRCKKSREGLEFLKNKTADFELVEYLKNPPSESQLKNIIKMLGIKPIDLVRKQEEIYKKEYKDKLLSDDECIKMMTEHPKLIERPIVIKDGKAVIGRPASNIEELF